ncbi:tetratricopeptide repeat protein [Sedimentitalea sp. JM2-8]|uniref:Tetratricopeptide repeat protein n=1 Tax=Sedimentitalea xiamensis TaxID=3050037 RepID=A0ABT7FGG9_9RHOB|nr:tetratricopeptide repeat protein [Sedimentitalea xiamensis]MDK3074145.1 tetratricopeptide repeat protein [Sedimentitalea xiamensis]
MRILAALLVALPSYVFAASDDPPPKPTQTTKTCKGAMVWDAKAQKCVNPQNSKLEGDTLYQAVRELAYAGRYADAQGVLAAMDDQTEDRVLTYWGFTYRKMGRAERARDYYRKAIARNPDNILARSYMAQGFVEDGRIDDAIAQWREIKARGGAGTWTEASLRDAIRTGTTYSY